MSDQLRRASVSITSNIAEGINRYSVKDKSHFIEMSYGSLMEVSSQFEIAEELGYITAEERLSMDQLIEEVARLLSGLQKTFVSFSDRIAWSVGIRQSMPSESSKIRMPPSASG